jgi:hypothetical protein
LSLSVTTWSCASAQIIYKVTQAEPAANNSSLVFCRLAPYQLTCASGAALVNHTWDGASVTVALQLHQFLTSLILAQDQRWRRA